MPRFRHTQMEHRFTQRGTGDQRQTHATDTQMQTHNRHTDADTHNRHTDADTHNRHTDADTQQTHSCTNNDIHQKGHPIIHTHTDISIQQPHMQKKKNAQARKI